MYLWELVVAMVTASWFQICINSYLFWCVKVLKSKLTTVNNLRYIMYYVYVVARHLVCCHYLFWQAPFRLPLFAHRMWWGRLLLGVRVVGSIGLEPADTHALGAQNLWSMRAHRSGDQDLTPGSSIFKKLKVNFEIFIADRKATRPST